MRLVHKRTLDESSHRSPWEVPLSERRADIRLMRSHPLPVLTAAALSEVFGVRPFSSRDALEVVSRDRLESAVRRGLVIRVRRGFFVMPADGNEPESRSYQNAVRAALLANPGCAAHRESAAALHGLYDPRFVQAWAGLPVFLVHEGSHRRKSAELVIRTSRVPNEDIRSDQWGRVTTPIRTALDLAAVHGFDRSLVVLDHALRLMAIEGVQPFRERAICSEPDVVASTRREAFECLERSGIRRGAGVASWAVSHAHPAAESPGESLSRARILLAGFPVPELNAPVSLPTGVVYPDMLWRAAGVIGEVDGRMKYRLPDDLYAEKRREDRLRAAGFLVVRWTVADMLARPGRVLAELSAALMSRGALVRPFDASAMRGYSPDNP